MQRYDFVFVVLCYRNTGDLLSFVESVKNIDGSYRVIVVNSFYDEPSRIAFEVIAHSAGYDFLNVPNQGYGAGNNRGIEFANLTYQYRFLVISNPDIEFCNWSSKLLDDLEDYILGPQIINAHHKHQNPYKPYQLRIIDAIEYFAFKRKIPGIFFYVGTAINRLLREYVLLTNRLFKFHQRKTYTVHGSCLVLGYRALNKIGSPYDEKMFLYAEEHELGYLAKSHGVSLYLIASLQVVHREYGSTSMIDKKALKEYERQSYIYCYEKWHHTSKMRKNYGKKERDR